jgi:heme/copper-type cytochrome/quinol oxidase subunit 4
LNRNYLRNSIRKVRGYVKENWGSPFIIGFMLLLVVAAFSLSVGWTSIANTIVVYAFYALVGGVVLQLVCFLKYPDKNEGGAV